MHKSEKISDKYQLAGVIGMPAAHSLSPAIHNYWIKKEGVSAFYVPIEMSAADFRSLIDLGPKIGFRGYNITAPHKELAYALCDVVSPEAERAKSVNLIIFDGGTIRGDSTDGFGFIANLEAEAGFTPDGKCIAILGAGGAARSIVDGLVAAGAGQIRIANRTSSRAKALEAIAPDRVHASEVWPAEESFFRGADLIIHATTFGMKGDNAGDNAPWRLPPLHRDVIAAELIYAPLETPFLRDAAAAGATPVDGLGMLLHQARPCFEAWFGPKVDVDAGLRAEITAILKSREDGSK